MIKVTVHEETEVNEKTTKPCNSPSRNHDSAAPRQHPLICTGAGPIHPVHGPPKLRAKSQCSKIGFTFSPFSRRLRENLVVLIANTSALVPDDCSQCPFCVFPIMWCAFGAHLDVGLAERQTPYRFIRTVRVCFPWFREDDSLLIRWICSAGEIPYLRLWYWVSRLLHDDDCFYYFKKAQLQKHSFKGAVAHSLSPNLTSWVLSSLFFTNGYYYISFFEL